MAFSAGAVFMRGRIFRCATSSSNTSRIPRRPEAGACYRQVIPATRGFRVFTASSSEAASDKWTAPVMACAFFAASSASRAAFSASFCFFTFHFGGVVTLMMVFRLRVGVSPSVFRFQCRYRSFLLCRGCPDLCENMSSGSLKLLTMILS